MNSKIKRTMRLQVEALRDYDKALMANSKATRNLANALEACNSIERTLRVLQDNEETITHHEGNQS